MDSKFSLGGGKANDATPVNKESQDIQPAGNTPAGFSATSETKEELESQYVDKRTVTINLKQKYSLYRQANDKSLPKRHDVIGSSLISSRTLTSNNKEMEAYMPQLIGIAPNNEDFVSRVKAYFNNFSVVIDELGKTLDISFRYNHKRDYYKVIAEENKINDKYESASKRTVDEIKEALKEKINDLNLLESSKWQYGSPLNLEDYLLYRHCLLYRDIAKDMALINSDPNIRFYFKDDKKEAERELKLRAAKNNARSNYVQLLNNKELFDAVLIQYAINSNIPINNALNMSRTEQEELIDNYSNNEPIKFNNICTDKDVILKGLIERLIAKGELQRMTHNQNITTYAGEFIGANMKEALTWFKNPEHNALVENYKNKVNS